MDALGLTRFQPAPDFGSALNEFLAQPTERTHDLLWRQCALDLDSVRRRMGEHWEPFKSYHLDRVLTPGVMAALATLMEQFGAPAISPAELARITVATTLIWGRHDQATPLRTAEAASARYGWRLHVIENAADEPPIEQPQAFLRALNAALALEGVPG